MALVGASLMKEGVKIHNFVTNASFWIFWLYKFKNYIYCIYKPSSDHQTKSHDASGKGGGDVMVQK